MGVLETQIDDIKHTVHQVLKGMDGVKEALSSTPRAIPFKEIIVSISVTLGVVVMLGQSLASWHGLANQNLNYRVELLEKHLHRQFLQSK